jgi:hypothetical protein
MRIVSHEEYLTKVEPILRKVFVGDDPFEPSFAPNIQGRRIIYRYKYSIDPPFTDALIEAASKLGDEGCYISTLWRPSHEPWHWYIPFSEFNSAYVEHRKEFDEFDIWLIYSGENILYSPQGKWGIMFSHESHALLGGPQEFIEEIQKTVPDLDLQVCEFLKFWKYCKDNYSSAETAWLPEVLAQVYGQENAEKMLRENGLL